MPEEISWYISNIHCYKALGYLHAKLVEEGHIPYRLTGGVFIDMWKEALNETKEDGAPSPLGPDQETVRKFLLATIEGRVAQVENRYDNVEQAVVLLSDFLRSNHTRYGRRDHHKIQELLYGPTSSSPEIGPDAA